MKTYFITDSDGKEIYSGSKKSIGEWLINNIESIQEGVFGIIKITEQ